MRRRMVLVSALVMVIAACGTDGKVIVVNATDNATTVELPIDGTLQIELAGNPTTGYTWEVVTSTGLTVIGEPVHRPESDLAGAPGVTTFDFEPTGATTGQIDLVYHRPWEDEPPLDRFTISVVIKD